MIGIIILIATIDAGITKVHDVLLEPQAGLKYIVSHQVTAEAHREIPAVLRRKDLVISQIEGRGLSRNRNNALNLIIPNSSDIVLLADDDVRYRPQYLQTVREAFAADPQLDMACFKIATPAGQPEYKDYSAEPYLLNRESRHYISSIEIAFRAGPVKEHGIIFDERFGLGSEIVPSGEEAVFIYDCIRAGLRVKYIPAYAVEHEYLSATKTLGNFTAERNVFKGAYDARRYGWRAYPAAFYDLLWLGPQLRASGRTNLAYLRERLCGARYILKN
jgi:hypothetical protein